MQAKLPDINAAIVRHRTLALEGFKSNSSEMCIVSIESINALLPILEDGTSYKVEVNSPKYNQLSQETREIECKKCKTQNKLENVVQYDLELDWLEKILAEQPAHRMWICISCGKSSKFDSDDITVTKKGNPYFFKVMPSPPARTNGIRGRMTFDKDFQTWFSIAMPEIESQIGIYRSEYAKQEDDLEEIPIED
jgi:hypothetical protein